MEEYSKEQLKELYEQLPENLKKAVFSTEIGERIRQISLENKVNDYLDIIKKVGYVFLGILSPNDFKKELNNPEIFKRINDEVFSSLKSDLEPLYGIKINSPANSAPAPRKKSDKYLETIE